MRLYVRTDAREQASLDLADGDGVLVGRQPDRGSLRERAADLPVTRELAVSSPSVSGNHLHLSVHGGTVELRELDSRNGTWLELDRHARVTLHGPPEVRVRLAVSSEARSEVDEPADATWTYARDFGPAVATAVQAWLDGRGVGAKVRAIARRAPAAPEDRLGLVPLGRDADLVIDAVHTMDTTWLMLLRRVERYVERQVARWSAEEHLREMGLIVASPAMKRAVREVVDAARRPGRALLLLGPSGSGKEGLARCYHTYARPTGTFVSRNCAQYGFGKDLVVSELFGAERGAFTGATRALTGAVESAHEGTLFLDELGELPLDVQSMLLRFLDRGEYTKLGGSAVHASDVRLVGATNKDLRAACISGEFRRDLWFRLAAEVIEVPPLSERFDDVAAYLRERSRGDGASLFDAMEPGALEVLRHHAWEGNFRELINFVNRLPDHGSIDTDTCRRLLAAGSILPVSSRRTSSETSATGATDTSSLHELAASAYAADHEGQAPRTWDEVKELVELYLKPVLFAALSGADTAPNRDAVDLRAAAERVRADRGTAAKQLDRYFARFAGKDG